MPGRHPESRGTDGPLGAGARLTAIGPPAGWRRSGGSAGPCVSRPGGASRRSSHVRNTPKATVGRQNGARRDGPIPEVASLFDHLVDAGR
jgi:hypothetical protein